jgi:hypothetical protein
VNVVAPKHQLRVRELLALMAFAATTSLTDEARAEDDPASVAAARTLGVDGVKLADGGNCRDAIDRLERAERLHHAPTTLGRLGECYVSMGRLVLGSEVLQRVLREPLQTGGPSAFVSARARAQRVVDETRPKIAQLRIVVQVPTSATADVKLDGETLPSAFLDVDRPTDPGPHEIWARATGFVEVSRTVTLAEGERSEVVLNLTPVAAPAAEPQPVVDDASPPAVENHAPVQTAHSGGTDARRNVGYVLLAAGGAGIAVGAVFGVLALGSKGDLDSACGADKGCPPDQRDTITALKTQGTVSTAGFVLGGLSLATGVVLVLTSGAPTTTGAARPSRIARFGLGAGPGSILLHGQF